MKPKPTTPQLSASALSFARQYFSDHQQLIYQKTDRMLVKVMLLQWVAGILIAIWISPRVWAGLDSGNHSHVWAALLLGGAITFFPVVLGSIRPGEVSTRHVIAIGQMLMGALLVHLMGGRVQTQVHVFLSLAILAFYRDWQVLITATLVVAAAHFLRGLFWPEPVYGVITASSWQTIEQAVWVILADIFLVISCLRNQRDMWKKALQHSSLDANEKGFRQLADAMPQIVWTANPDGAVDYYNRRWFDYTGMILRETEDWGWKLVVHPADLDQVTQCWSQALRTGEKYEVEYRFKRASDGVYRWHLGRASAVRDDDGRIIKWYGTCTDIDDQKRAEDALLAAREELEARVNARTMELATANEGLTLEIIERKRIEAEQQILFELMQGFPAAATLDEQLKDIHNSLGKVLKAENCFVALHDKNSGLFKMQFFVDQYDGKPAPQRLEKSRTAYVFRTGKPILMTRDVFDQLVSLGELESIGSPPASWLGVPLRTASEVIGVLVVQHYADQDAYSNRDLEFLSSVGGQIALLIERNRADEALRESEAQFKELFDRAPVAYHELDREGRIVKANLTEQRMLGYTAEELQGHYAWEFIIEKTSQRAIAAKLSGELPLLPVERTFVRKDGTHVLLLLQDELIVDKTGSVNGIRTTLHDITERKQAEARLRDSEERYRDLFDNAQDAIYVHDLNGIYISANRAAEKLVGYTHDEILGKNIIDFMAPKSADLIRANIAKKLKGGGLTSYEIEVLSSDGSHVPVEVSTRMIYENGVPVAVQGMARDITERKRIESALQENQLHLVEAQHLALMGSWDWDVANNKTSWSEGLCHIYGIRPESSPATYEGYLSLAHPDDREKISEQIESAVQTGQGCSFEHRIIWPDKSVRFHHVILRVAHDEEGRSVKLFGTAQDVTDRVQLEEDLKEARDAAIESARLKSEFLANMSHEIRTPMNGVVGMTGLLLDTELDSDQREFAETIRSSGDALLTIINDILDFSKIEAGKLEFEIVDFNLRNAVEETIELLAERARAKRLEFASLISYDVPTGLRGDPGRLRQVLTNLVGNALKFTERGEVIVRAEKESESETAVTIRFTVSDTGIGISDAAQARLFQAFTQADGSTTRKYGGTGLGLSISKQLVELMGGQIGVTSAPGEGSTFWFTSKLEKQPAAVAAALRQVQSIENLRVLIVDDNATNRKILSHQLGSWGMIHTAVNSGAQALELLKAAAAAGAGYDLAVLDLLMPELDGFGLARAIKADPTIAGVKLILLTSAGLRGDAATARAAGLEAYLTKPVRQSQLFDCLTMVVNNSARPNELRNTARLVTKHTLHEGKRLSNKLILLAEDNIVNQKVAVRQLQKLGYRADAVANGREAIEALGRISYDLVLMDCQMPEMDGYEATAEIRRREATGKHTPIVAMTAHALTGDREKSIAAGMDDHITKPVKQEDLARVLEQLLAGPAANVVATVAEVPVLAPPVDLNRLQQAVGDDPKDILEILDLYRAEMTESLIKLDEAIDSGNSVAVNMIAHSCAGTSANCGMVAVVEDLRKLELMGRENQLLGAAPLNAQVGLEFERIKRFLLEKFEPATN